MYVSSLNLNNTRGFIDATFEFSKKLNIIVGPNNSGKTTILKSLLCMQDPANLLPQDKRALESTAFIKVNFEDVTKRFVPTQYSNLLPNTFLFDFAIDRHLTFFASTEASQALVCRGTVGIPQTEPNNFIYPYLSKRKVIGFSDSINSGLVFNVTGNLSNLYPKIDRVSNPEFVPAYNEFVQACDDILGFRVSCTASANGKTAAYIIRNFDQITIESMGEGVANLLGLIVDLCVAENKLFLIEEPENDIHPKALKKLLELIIKKSENNQFIITTHSNIVTKYLGAQPDSKIISVKMTFQDRIPTSEFEYVDTQEKRRTLLEDLGYELFDSDLWDSWLFLEESSAERIIRDFLIPLFVPKLQGRLKTFSARTTSEIESKFSDFNNLFVFLHLQPSYKNKAWVILDAGDKEKEIIDRMKEKYSTSGWDETRFMQFKEHEFEAYYPAAFRERIFEISEIKNKAEKRLKKKELLDDVLEWCREDEDRTKRAFQETASEIISILKMIESVSVKGAHGY